MHVGYAAAVCQQTVAEYEERIKSLELEVNTLRNMRVGQLV